MNRPLFERRHYREIADVIGKSAAREVSFENLLKEIKDMLNRDNERFSKERFNKRIQSTYEDYR